MYVYEPPLTNLFTMHWFLPLYATMLLRDAALAAAACMCGMPFWRGQRWSSMLH